jgi:hypothetical protein
MMSLANFGGMSFDHDALDRLVAAWNERTGNGNTSKEASRG